MPPVCARGCRWATYSTGTSPAHHGLFTLLRDGLGSDARATISFTNRSRCRAPAEDARGCRMTEPATARPAAPAPAPAGARPGAGGGGRAPPLALPVPVPPTRLVGREQEVAAL